MNDEPITHESEPLFNLSGNIALVHSDKCFISAGFLLALGTLVFFLIFGQTR